MFRPRDNDINNIRRHNKCLFYFVKYNFSHLNRHIRYDHLTNPLERSLVISTIDLNKYSKQDYLLIHCKRLKTSQYQFQFFKYFLNPKLIVSKIMTCYNNYNPECMTVSRRKIHSRLESFLIAK